MATFKDDYAPIILRPLQDLREYIDRQGTNLQLCVAHELDANAQYSVQAIVIYNGASLCREHLEIYSKQQAFMRGTLI